MALKQHSFEFTRDPTITHTSQSMPSWIRSVRWEIGVFLTSLWTLMTLYYKHSLPRIALNPPPHLLLLSSRHNRETLQR